MSDVSLPKVYIVILNYLHWHDTRDCLQSVLKSSYSNFSVIVADNNSQNQSLEHLIEWGKDKENYELYDRGMLNNSIDVQSFPRLTFIQNDVNGGFAAGNNIVLRLLTGINSYVWLLNPDMTVREDALSELINFAACQTSDCIIGAEVRTYSGDQELLFYGGGRVNFLSGTIQLARNSKNIEKLDYISGGCLFTHTSSFIKLGLLPENYFLYWEETDWCYRAKQQGLSLVVCRSAVCYDKISTVIGKGFLSDYYYSRNGLLFISKFRKENIPIALFSMVLRFLKRVIIGQWNRAWGVFKGTIDFLKRKFNEIQ